MDDENRGTSKLILPISIIVAGLLIGGSIYLNGRLQASKQTRGGDTGRVNGGIAIKSAMRPIDANDHVLGSANARIIIVEYSDTECPFCKSFHPTLQTIMKEYGSKGSVAWVFRHFPIAELHKKSEKEAEALECAAELGGNSKFWEYVNKIYEVTPSNDGLDPAELPKIATKIGLSSSQFMTCLDSGQYKSRVQADMTNAEELGASGTPYNILIDTKNNEYYPLEGAYPYSRLKQVIDMILQS